MRRNESGGAFGAFIPCKTYVVETGCVVLSSCGKLPFADVLRVSGTEQETVAFEVFTKTDPVPQEGTGRIATKGYRLLTSVNAL
jgi:hypothetical protein